MFKITYVVHSAILLNSYHLLTVRIHHGKEDGGKGDGPLGPDSCSTPRVSCRQVAADIDY